MNKLLGDYRKWQIIKDDLTDLNPNLLDESLLTEDLLQMKQGDFIVDAGWYEGANFYIVYLIKDNIWDEPIIKICSPDLQTCYQAIEFCLSYAEELM